MLRKCYESAIFVGTRPSEHGERGVPLRELPLYLLGRGFGKLFDKPFSKPSAKVGKRFGRGSVAEICDFPFFLLILQAKLFNYG